MDSRIGYNQPLNPINQTSYTTSTAKTSKTKNQAVVNNTAKSGFNEIGSQFGKIPEKKMGQIKANNLSKDLHKDYGDPKEYKKAEAAFKKDYAKATANFNKKYAQTEKLEKTVNKKVKLEEKQLQAKTQAKLHENYGDPKELQIANNRFQMKFSQVLVNEKKGIPLTQSKNISTVKKSTTDSSSNLHPALKVAFTVLGFFSDRIDDIKKQFS